MRVQAANDFTRSMSGPTVGRFQLVDVMKRIVFVGNAATAASLAGMLVPGQVDHLDREQAIVEIAAGRIGLLILELDGPLARLTNDLTALREAAVRRPLPVIALVPRHAVDTIVAAFELGAADVAGLPLVAGEISARVGLLLRRVGAAGHLRAKVHAARLQAMTDPVTRLYNRNYFDHEAEHAIAAARKAGQPLTLLMIDIDLLKPVNDRFGHAAGDRVLASVAAQLISSLRSNDIVARIGGDEIVVAMPGTDVETAVLVAQRLCASIAGTPIGDIKVTVSIGVAGLMAGDSGTAALLARADAALYAGKRGGRNRVEVAP